MGKCLFSESTWPGVFPEKALDPFYSQKIRPISLPQDPNELKRFLKKNENSVYQGYNIHKWTGGLKIKQEKRSTAGSPAHKTSASPEKSGEALYLNQKTLDQHGHEETVEKSTKIYLRLILNIHFAPTRSKRLQTAIQIHRLIHITLNRLTMLRNIKMSLLQDFRNPHKIPPHYRNNTHNSTRRTRPLTGNLPHNPAKEQTNPEPKKTEEVASIALEYALTHINDFTTLVNEPFTSNKVDDIAFSKVMLIKDAKLPNEVTLGQIKKLVK